MGVKGLLPCLQSITRFVPLERYRGLTAAVDAMSWLHKGVFACDVKSLARSQRDGSEQCGSAELRCIKYVMDKVDLLRGKFGIEVILVIDGDSLPSKKEENAQRREDRQNAFEKALAAEKAGDSRAARRFYAQSCSVTYKIRYELIQACKQARVKFMVAPYEADAQMARLAISGIADLVITEDSDLLCYGCPRILTKIDFETCKGQEIQLMKDLGENELLSFKNWTHDMFVFMCILSGCDYSKGVPGIGIKLAHKIVRVHRTPSKIFSALKAAGRLPRGFEDEFWIAFRTFRHQRVFCPSKQQCETLFPIPGSHHDSAEVWSFLGVHIEPRIAAGIADGTLHPSEKLEWDVALRGSVKFNHSRHINDLEIHHRSPPHKQRRKEKESNGKNIWHELVYGSDGGRRRQVAEQTDVIEPSRQSTNQTSKDMFRFFSTSTRSDKAETTKNRESLEATDTRPPLKEIFVDENASQYSMSKQAIPPPPGHKDLPVHFHEYKSQLVGNNFKPIIRLRLKRGNVGTKSTEVVQRIWQKSSSYRHRAPQDQENCNGHIDSCKRTDKSGGISMFSRENNPTVSALLQHLDYDYGLIGFEENDERRHISQRNELSEKYQDHHCPSLPSERNRNRYNDYDQRGGSHVSVSSFGASRSKLTHQPSEKSEHHRGCDKNFNYQSSYDETLYHRSHPGRYDKSDNKQHRERNHIYADADADSASHLRQRRDTISCALNSYHHPKQHDRCDLRSFASGCTTAEPESYASEPTKSEFPPFPSQLESDSVFDTRQSSDFEDSLNAALACETNANHANLHQISDYHPDEYEHLEVFRVFQTQKKAYDSHCEDRRPVTIKGELHDEDRSRIYGMFHCEREAEFDLQKELADADAWQEEEEQLYDDGLLMAFDEMHRL
jgi:exonuclease-1